MNATDVRKEKYERYVGQMLIVRHTLGQDLPDDLGSIQNVILNGEVNRSLNDELASFEQLKVLIKRVSERVKGMVCIDYEGGRICRWGADMPSVPSAYALSLSPEHLGEAAEVMGKQLSYLGIDMLLGPVVDIGGEKSAFPTRCYGDNPDSVTEIVKPLLMRLSPYVWTCLKHYPGHGSVQGDSHDMLPQTLLDQELLESVHMAPFHNLAKQTNAVMTAHIKCPVFDKENSATFSETILERLRKEFGGIIITDSLTMQAVLDQYGNKPLNVAIAAIRAGSNMLIVGDLKIDHAKILHSDLAIAALQDRSLRQKIKASAIKINSLFLQRPQKISIKGEVLAKQAEAFTTQIAKSVLKVKRPFQFPALEPLEGLMILAPVLLKEKVTDGFQRAFDRPLSHADFWVGSVDPTELQIEGMLKMAMSMTDIVIFTYNADILTSQQQLVLELSRLEHKPMIRICETNFAHQKMDWVPLSADAVCTYSGDPISLSIGLQAFAGKV